MHCTLCTCVIPCVHIKKRMALVKDYIRKWIINKCNEGGKVFRLQIYVLIYEYVPSFSWYWSDFHFCSLFWSRGRSALDIISYLVMPRVNQSSCDSKSSDKSPAILKGVAKKNTQGKQERAPCKRRSTGKKTKTAEAKQVDVDKKAVKRVTHIYGYTNT